MKRETQIALVEQATRTAWNMTSEAMSNYGEALPADAREKLRAVTQTFADFGSSLKS